MSGRSDGGQRVFFLPSQLQPAQDERSCQPSVWLGSIECLLSLAASLQR